jgi:hypothetical protein
MEGAQDALGEVARRAVGLDLGEIDKIAATGSLEASHSDTTGWPAISNGWSKGSLVKPGSSRSRSVQSA